MSSLIDKLFDKTIPGLNKTLNLAWKRNQAIVSNIANAETPGYRAVDMTFGKELEEAFNKHKSELKLTSPKHMDIEYNSSAHLVPDNSGATKPDGNNVDIDIQMGKLVQNAGKYSSAASLVRKKLHMLRMAIREAVR